MSEWTCSHCGFVNREAFVHCDSCSEMRGTVSAGWKRMELWDGPVVGVSSVGEVLGTYKNLAALLADVFKEDDDG